MLEALIVILLVLWLLGAVSDIAGGLVHLLLIVIAVLVVVRLVRGQSV